MSVNVNQLHKPIPIFNEAGPTKLKFEIVLSKVIVDLLKKSMGLLGIGVPEKM